METSPEKLGLDLPEALQKCSVLIPVELGGRVVTSDKEAGLANRGWIGLQAVNRWGWTFSANTPAEPHPGKDFASPRSL